MLIDGNPPLLHLISPPELESLLTPENLRFSATPRMTPGETTRLPLPGQGNGPEEVAVHPLRTTHPTPTLGTLTQTLDLPFRALDAHHPGPLITPLTTLPPTPSPSRPNDHPNLTTPTPTSPSDLSPPAPFTPPGQNPRRSPDGPPGRPPREPSPGRSSRITV